MTATGQLYLDETCRDYFRKELDEAFGKDKWRIKANSDVWDLSQLPDKCDVEIDDDETDEKIGVAEITNKFEIIDGGEGKYCEPTPFKIKIKKCKIKPFEKLYNKYDGRYGDLVEVVCLFLKRKKLLKEFIKQEVG